MYNNSKINLSFGKSEDNVQRRIKLVVKQIREQDPPAVAQKLRRPRSFSFLIFPLIHLKTTFEIQLDHFETFVHIKKKLILVTKSEENRSALQLNRKSTRIFHRNMKTVQNFCRELLRLQRNLDILLVPLTNVHAIM